MKAAAAPENSFQKAIVTFPSGNGKAAMESGTSAWSSYFDSFVSPDSVGVPKSKCRGMPVGLY